MFSYCNVDHHGATHPTAKIVLRAYEIPLRYLASVEHHGVQPTGGMDNEPEPSRGVPC